ncbi:type II and III secretion system protein family protein [Aquisalimonas sp.]|uniref:type II and III secretion system protein family protein n=1 Tax=Aquisalimonas sp. TaxID=1872621 RepID=UPI0025BCF3CB|nr:type II and III secretion system protein family protein [Aquisalimonas sp.]
MNREGTTTLTGRCSMIALGAWLTLSWAFAAQAQNQDDAGRWAGMQRPGAPATVSIPQDGTTRTIEVAAGKSRVLQFPRPVKVVSVGDTDVADVLVMRARQIYVLGKSLGTTNVVLWDESNEIEGVLNVEVTHDLETLKAKLHEMLPREPIEVRSARGNLILGGRVSSAARMDYALRVARSFAHGGEDSVLNMMEVGGAQQVMLDVKAAEVSRSLIKRMGVRFNAFDSGAPWDIGAVQGGATFPEGMVSNFSPAGAAIENTGLFAAYQGTDFLFNMFIDAAQREGVAKILAEPNLTTLSGQEAHFLAGGEFPIPVPQDQGAVTIEHREFGVGLRFLPVVLDSGKINLKVDVSVSDLVLDGSLRLAAGANQEIATEFFVPALAKRSASSTVELGHGETIAIAGMIDESIQDSVDKFPFLGDLPVIGQLFRSQSFNKEQTELVIFVTPRLARPIEPAQARLPTGSFVAPNDLKFYLLGRYPRPGRGTPMDDDGGTDPVFTQRGGGAAGRFGHDM